MAEVSRCYLLFSWSKKKTSSVPAWVLLTKGELFCSSNFLKFSIVLRPKPSKIRSFWPAPTHSSYLSDNSLSYTSFGHSLIEMQHSQKQRHFFLLPNPPFPLFSIQTQCRVSHLSEPESELHLWLSPVFSSK